jgi:hypothetical protein
MREKSISIWKEKLDWIVARGGMALINTHPDYMNLSERPCSIEEYPAARYREFLSYVRHRYADEYWHVLPRDIARFWKNQPKTKITGGSRDHEVKERETIAG